MEVKPGAARAGQGPIVFVAPFVFAHDENAHRLLVRDAVVFALEQPVVPAQHRAIEINRQVRAEIHRADFSAARAASVPADVNEQTLPLARGLRAAFGFQVRVVVQRAAKKNVVPRGLRKDGHLNFRVVVLDRKSFPVGVEIGMQQPVAEIRGNARRRNFGQRGVIEQRQRGCSRERVGAAIHLAMHGVFRETR